MPAIARSDVPAAIEAMRLTGSDEFDLTKEHEVHTDKDAVKLLPCRECKRPLVTTVFFAAAKAICRACEGTDENPGVATVGQPVPGSTDPAKAVNLADCLINAHFAKAVCPVHPDDPLHEMELIAVNHSDDYGPGYWVGKTWRQTAKGETVTLQCQHENCLAVVTYSTRHVIRYRRQNEPRTQPNLGAPHRNSMLGVKPGTKDPTAVMA